VGQKNGHRQAQEGTKQGATRKKGDGGSVSRMICKNERSHGKRSANVEGGIQGGRGGEKCAERMFERQREDSQGGGRKSARGEEASI